MRIQILILGLKGLKHIYSHVNKVNAHSSLLLVASMGKGKIKKMCRLTLR